jgi:hypothetical protein
LNPENTQVFVQIFCSFLAAMALIYTFTPDRKTGTQGDKTRLAYLYERKDMVYENLRDMNFEFKSGKFTQADYDSMHETMEAEAAHILDEIEMLELGQSRRSTLD